jgi:ABC-2 type transport system ATP-binding protein
MKEAEALSDSVGIMRDGKLLIIGTVQEIIKKTNANSFEDAFIAVVKEGEK